MKSIQPNHWIGEINKADARLRAFPNTKGQSQPGKPRAAAMRWALKFALENLDELSEGDLANRQRELQCFRLFEMKEEPYLYEGVANYPPWPIPAMMKLTQDWLRIALEHIRERRVFKYMVPGREDTWVPLPTKGRRKPWQTHVTVRTIEPAVRQFADLLEEHRERLRECNAEDCPRLFLQDRSNQDYCCRQHQWKQDQRKRKGISADRYGKHGPKTKSAKSNKQSPTSAGGRHATKRRTR